MLTLTLGGATVGVHSIQLPVPSNRGATSGAAARMLWRYAWLMIQLVVICPCTAVFRLGLNMAMALGPPIAETADKPRKVRRVSREGMLGRTAEASMAMTESFPPADSEAGARVRG